MITVPTLDGSMPRARSCAAAACSGRMSMSGRAAAPNSPRFERGLTATEAWKPVSIRIGPAPGCSTRKHWIGAFTHWSFGTPSPNALRHAMRPSSRRNHAIGARTVAVRIGRELDVRALAAALQGQLGRPGLGGGRHRREP